MLTASFMLHTGVFGIALGLEATRGAEAGVREFVLTLEREPLVASLAPAVEEPLLEPPRETAPPVPAPPPPPDEPHEPFVAPAPDLAPVAPLPEEPPAIPPDRWIARVIVRAPEPPAPAPPDAPAPAPRAEPTPLPGENKPPRYPVLALRQRLAGEVVVDVHVDAQGRVTRCELARSSGHRVLDEAALAALARWRFRDGPGVTRYPVVFRLD